MQAPPNDDSFIHDEAIKIRTARFQARATARASIDAWLDRCAEVAQRSADHPEQFNLEMSDPSRKHVITTDKAFDLCTLMRLRGFDVLHEMLKHHAELHQSAFPFEVEVRCLSGADPDPYAPEFVLLAHMPQ